MLATLQNSHHFVLERWSLGSFYFPGRGALLFKTFSNSTSIVQNARFESCYFSTEQLCYSGGGGTLVSFSPVSLPVSQLK